jgi:hypothetical protein
MLRFLPAPAVHIPTLRVGGYLRQRAERFQPVAETLLIRKNETDAKIPKELVTVNPVGVETDRRPGSGNGGGEDQMAAGFQDPGHLPEGLAVGLEVDGIAVPTQAKMFQGAEGKNQIERSIRKIELFGVPGEDRFVGGQGAPVAHIHRRNREMGQQTQDEMAVGPDVEDGPGGGALNILGGKSALKVDKSFRMASRFKHRLGENLKRTRILAKKGEIPVVIHLKFFRKLDLYLLLRGLDHFSFPFPHALGP